MIIIDIFVVLFCLALAIVFGPVVAQKMLHYRDPKRKELEQAQELDERGEINTVRHNLTELRRCHHCKKLTDPGKDLRVSAAWVHADCYLKDKDKDNA